MVRFHGRFSTALTSSLFYVVFSRLWLSNLVFLICLFWLTACSSSTGGTIGGLFPAPKFTEGEIKNNHYVSLDGDFSIGLPHQESSYEYRYMEMKEQYGEESEYVSFGPAAMDGSIYRLLFLMKNQK